MEKSIGCERPCNVIVWVNDDTTFTFAVRDTNGTVDSVIINWGDGKPLDTLVLLGNPGDTSVNHKYPIAEMQTYNVAVTAIDDDGIRSTENFPVLVKKGAPRVWVDGDTLFVPTPAIGGDIDIPVNSIDSNGTIDKYWWDFIAGNGLDTNDLSIKTTTDSIYDNFFVSSGSVNEAMQMAVFCRDDDGIAAGDTFWLYPDGPPDTAIIIRPAQDTVYGKDPVIIQWTGLDEHDSLATEFAVMLDYPDGGDVYDTLQGFLPASDYKQGTVFEYQFTPTAGGTYKMRILSRDRTGSTTWGRKREFGYPF